MLLLVSLFVAHPAACYHCGFLAALGFTLITTLLTAIALFARLLY
jgi:hypothetical protein